MIKHAFFCSMSQYCKFVKPDPANNRGGEAMVSCTSGIMMLYFFGLINVSFCVILSALASAWPENPSAGNIKKHCGNWICHDQHDPSLRILALLHWPSKPKRCQNQSQLVKRKDIGSWCIVGTSLLLSKPLKQPNMRLMEVKVGSATRAQYFGTYSLGNLQTKKLHFAFYISFKRRSYFYSSWALKTSVPETGGRLPQKGAVGTPNSTASARGSVSKRIVALERGQSSLTQSSLLDSASQEGNFTDLVTF